MYPHRFRWAYVCVFETEEAEVWYTLPDRGRVGASENVNEARGLHVHTEWVRPKFSKIPLEKTWKHISSHRHSIELSLRSFETLKYLIVYWIRMSTQTKCVIMIYERCTAVHLTSILADLHLDRFTVKGKDGIYVCTKEGENNNNDSNRALGVRVI